MSEQEFELRQTLPEEYKQIPDAYREKTVELYVQFQTGNYENTIKTARKLLECFDIAKKCEDEVKQAIAKIASIGSEAVRVFLKKNYEMYKKQQPAGWSDKD